MVHRMRPYAPLKVLPWEDAKRLVDDATEPGPVKESYSNLLMYWNRHRHYSS